jgi:DNA-binding NarL/FixJ family response regulator
VVRDGLRRVIEERHSGVTFGEAATSEEALALVLDLPWDVVVLDISLPGRSGLDLLPDITRARPGLPVLVLSIHEEDQYARRAFRSGALGYIVKSSRREDVLAAVERVAGGRRYISPDMAERLAHDLYRPHRHAHEALSAREFEVIRLLGSGRTVTQVAAALSLSDKTISTYRARILDKLGLATTAALIRYVIENHLL